MAQFCYSRHVKNAQDIRFTHRSLKNSLTPRIQEPIQTIFENYLPLKHMCVPYICSFINYPFETNCEW